MTTPRFFLQGRNIQAKYRQNGIPLIAVFKSMVVEELAEEMHDDADGEERSRQDLVIEGYRVTLAGYFPDFITLDTWLADTANDDASKPSIVKTIQFTALLRDGTRRVFTTHGMFGSRGPFNFHYENRKYILAGYSFKCQIANATSI